MAASHYNIKLVESSSTLHRHSRFQRRSWYRLAITELVNADIIELHTEADTRNDEMRGQELLSADT
jgi:hypothetical protein